MNQIKQNNLKTIFLLFSCFYFFTSNSQTVATLAGNAGGFADGTVTTAQFFFPSGVTVATDGTIYVADTNNNRIRKITSAGSVTTLAGSTNGFADGTGTTVKFNNPQGVAVDATGNVYVADPYNNRIRKITSAGVVTTLAGSTHGFADGTGTTAQFGYTYGVAVDASGSVYVADTDNHRIRKITSAGVVTTLAGSILGFSDGTGTAALFNSPYGLAVDADGNVYVADTINNRIRKITSAGVVTTLAGSFQGFVDGVGIDAQFNHPFGVAVDATGNVYVADTANNRIRKITSAGVVTTLAGSIQGFANGTGSVAKFNHPQGVAVDATGNVYVADAQNNLIRKITNTLANTNFQLQNQVSLYPNPASTFVNIKLEDISASKATILDINGRILQFENINDNNKTIDISNLDTGIYFIQINTDKGNVSKKFVKQ